MSKKRHWSLKLLEMIERERLCILPPHQGWPEWSVQAEFDGETDYSGEIGSGVTLLEALAMADSVCEDTEDVR